MEDDNIPKYFILSQNKETKGWQFVSYQYWTGGLYTLTDVREHAEILAKYNHDLRYIVVESQVMYEVSLTETIIE